MEKFMQASLVGDVTPLANLLPDDPLFDQMVRPHVTQTPLHVASLRGHAAFASKIFRLKPELNRTRNCDGFCPIHLASAWGHVDIVKEMLTANKSLARLCDGNGYTPLHAAAANNQVEVLAALVKEEPGLAIEVTGEGETALHVALKNYMIGAATHLIAHCKDILNVADGSGNTALHYAGARKQIQIINILLAEEDIKKNVQNTYGLTPLDMIQQCPAGPNDVEIIRSLSHAGCKSGRPQFTGSVSDTTTTPVDHSASCRTMGRWLKKLVPRGWNDWYRMDNKWLKEIRRTMMIVATLISAAAYQGGINPPKLPDQLGYDAVYYDAYLQVDMFALILSASVIVFLLSGLPLNRFTTWLLTLALWAAVTCLVNSFVAGVKLARLAENNPYESISDWVDMVNLVWLGMMACMFLYHFIALVFLLLLWLRRKAKSIIVRLVKFVKREWVCLKLRTGGRTLSSQDSMADSISEVRV